MILSSYPVKLDLLGRVVLVAAALGCALAAVQEAPASSVGLLSIRTPWCLAARPAANAAGYLVILNESNKSDRLNDVTSPAAERVSIHQSRVYSGVATMSVLDGVSIPARTSTKFAPGGLHIMLEALRRPLKAGDRVPITLWFKVAGQVHARLVVVLRPPVSTASSMQM